jgi:hypothetical protein
MATSTMRPTNAHPMATMGPIGLMEECSSGQARGFMVIAGSMDTSITDMTRIMATTVLSQITGSSRSIIFTQMKHTMPTEGLEILAMMATPNARLDIRAEATPGAAVVDMKAAVVTKAAATTRNSM